MATNGLRAAGAVEVGQARRIRCPVSQPPARLPRSARDNKEIHCRHTRSSPDRSRGRSQVIGGTKKCGKYPNRIKKHLGGVSARRRNQRAASTSHWRRGVAAATSWPLLSRRRDYTTNHTTSHIVACSGQLRGPRLLPSCISAPAHAVTSGGVEDRAKRPHRLLKMPAANRGAHARGTPHGLTDLDASGAIALRSPIPGGETGIRSGPGPDTSACRMHRCRPHQHGCTQR
jgi:hypothetical protein